MHFLHIANSDKPVALYSLDVVISVGYRVKSGRGVEFRCWANKVLEIYGSKLPVATRCLTAKCFAFVGCRAVALCIQSETCPLVSKLPADNFVLSAHRS